MSKHVTQAELMHASKVYEDALQRIIGEDAFDEWLESIPVKVDYKHYSGALYWMVANLRQYRKPSKAQIDNALNLTRINLTFNPAFGGTDKGGYFTA